MNTKTPPANDDDASGGGVNKRPRIKEREKDWTPDNDQKLIDLL
jgi:hypothetical protein